MWDLVMHLAFVFAVLGSKLLVGLWIIYNLFPTDSHCVQCDAETLRVHMEAGRSAIGNLLFLGRVRRHWCPECGWSGFTRRAPAASSSLLSAPLFADSVKSSPRG